MQLTIKKNISCIIYLQVVPNKLMPDVQRSQLGNHIKNTVLNCKIMSTICLESTMTNKCTLTI